MRFFDFRPLPLLPAILFVLACLTDSQGKNTSTTSDVMTSSSSQSYASDSAPIETKKNEIQPTTSSSSKVSKILLIGDSLGVGMSFEFTRIARRCGYVAKTHAISGSSTFQWIDWIKGDIKEHKPELVLVSLGTNDAMQFERAKKLNIYAEMDEKIADFGARAIWILPHKISKSRIPKIDLARSFIAVSVSEYFDSTLIEIPLAHDKVHTTMKGYNDWFVAVWNDLQNKKIIERCSL